MFLKDAPWPGPVRRKMSKGETFLRVKHISAGYN
jgi:hypothetical protein